MASITKVKGKTGITYNVRVRVGGQPTQSQNFKTRAEAKQWAVKTEATLTGRTFAVSRDARLGELIAEFGPKAKPSTRALLRYWDSALGHVRLRDITPPMIARHRDALLGAPTRSYGQKTSKPRSVMVPGWSAPSSQLLNSSSATQPRKTVFGDGFSTQMRDVPSSPRFVIALFESVAPSWSMRRAYLPG